MVRSKSGRRNLRRYEDYRKHEKKDCMTTVNCMVHLLWVLNIVGAPIFAIMAVYFGILIHNMDIQEGTVCDDVFASFTEIGIGLVLYGIISVLLYCCVGIFICSSIKCMPYNMRLTLSSTIYMVLMVVWLVFYGFMFYASYMAKNEYRDCVSYAPDLVEILDITIPAFSFHTLTMPFFFMVCIMNTIKSVDDDSR